MSDRSNLTLGITLHSIEEAYEVGRNAFHDLLEKCLIERRRLEKLREENGGEFPDDAADAWLIRRFEQDTLKQNLNLHAQSFALLIFHAWEAFACQVIGKDWMAWDDVKKVVKAGWPVDLVGIDKLRMTANCIKHNNGQLFKHHPELFL